MLRELEIYVKEQTKDGRTWDGNVPTNYKIKSNFVLPGDAAGEEEKNLGRWVNRQRSQYQAGKLKKDRQQDLERIGLKWSVLMTTSWSTMYKSLEAYAEEKRKQSPQGQWDGNVPANYKTKSNPPLSLGRWINRQRCAYAKNSLKADHVRQLEAVGLKWAIHVRHKINGDDNDVRDGDAEGGPTRSSSTLIEGVAPLSTPSLSTGIGGRVPSLPDSLENVSSHDNARAPEITN